MSENIIQQQDITLTGATGYESLEMGAARIHVDDKRIINCRADLNQLVPLNISGLGINI